MTGASWPTRCTACRSRARPCRRSIFYDARLGAVRGDLRPAGVLSDPHRVRHPRARAPARSPSWSGRAPCWSSSAAAPARKMRILLDALQRPAAYVPIDIAGEHLDAAARALGADYPGLEVHAGRRPTSPSPSTCRSASPRDGDARRLLSRLDDRQLHPGRGRRLPGQDALARPRAAASCSSASTCRRTPTILHAAYNDAQGVTAAFNLNLLDADQPRAGRRLRPRRLPAPRLLRPAAPAASRCISSA